MGKVCPNSLSMTSWAATEMITTATAARYQRQLNVELNNHSDDPTAVSGMPPRCFQVKKNGHQGRHKAPHNIQGQGPDRAGCPATKLAAGILKKANGPQNTKYDNPKVSPKKRKTSFKALFFCMGYSFNLTILSTLCQPGCYWSLFTPLAANRCHPPGPGARVPTFRR